MIAKAQTGRGFRGVLEYDLQEGKSVLLDTNLAGDTIRAMAHEFGEVRQLRPNLGQAVFHASISAAPGEHLTDPQWLEIAARYLDGIAIFLDFRVGDEPLTANPAQQDLFLLEVWIQTKPIPIQHGGILPRTNVLSLVYHSPALSAMGRTDEKKKSGVLNGRHPLDPLPASPGKENARALCSTDDCGFCGENSSDTVDDISRSMDVGTRHGQSPYGING